MTKIHFFECNKQSPKAFITDGIFASLWNTHYAHGYKWEYWFDCKTLENMGNSGSTVKIGNLYRALHVKGEVIQPWQYMAIMVFKKEDDG